MAARSSVYHGLCAVAGVGVVLPLQTQGFTRAGAAGRLNRQASDWGPGQPGTCPGGPGPPTQGPQRAGCSTSGNAALAPLRAQGRQERISVSIWLLNLEFWEGRDQISAGREGADRKALCRASPPPHPPSVTDRGTIYKRPILLGVERQERSVCE